MKDRIDAVRSLLTDPNTSEAAMQELLATLFNNLDKGSFNIDLLGKLTASIDSCRYAAQHMIDLPRLPSRAHLLSYAAERISVEDGVVLEFGVWSGTSINYLAQLLPQMKVYGFDSFEGLPEAWFGKRGGLGQFDRQGLMPDVRPNVELIKGWFDRTLPPFLDQHAHDIHKIALLHVDCDIYSSTQTVLASLHSRIVPGTIIVFDEYFNYPTWQRHEYLAFQEYVAFRSIKYEYIGLVPAGEQVAVRIIAV